GRVKRRPRVTEPFKGLAREQMTESLMMAQRLKQKNQEKEKQRRIEREKQRQTRARGMGGMER
ncbi:plasmid recombination enzyme, partial [Salmonella enterica subsp. enterica serovar Panama]